MLAISEQEEYVSRVIGEKYIFGFHDYEELFSLALYDLNGYMVDV